MRWPYNDEYKLTPAEQKEVDALEKAFDEMERRHDTVNGNEEPTVELKTPFQSYYEYEGGDS